MRGTTYRRGDVSRSWLGVPKRGEVLRDLNAPAVSNQYLSPQAETFVAELLVCQTAAGLRGEGTFAQLPDR